jgi:hypothetical protein
METWQIVHARQGSDLLLAGFQAREFASREYPSEDYRWVLESVAWVPTARKGIGLRARLAAIRRAFGTPGEVKTDPEATTERASA